MTHHTNPIIRLITGISLTATMLVLWLTWTATAQAEQPPTVHHPDCPGVIVDIAPGTPTPTAGVVYVKAGPEHVNIGWQPTGHVPTSPNGHDVSHVDVCPPTETTTTWPDTTTTTTEPAATTTTAPDTTSTTTPTTSLPNETLPTTSLGTVPDYSDPCIIDGISYPEGEYVLVDWPNNQGTTEWGYFGCSLPTVDIGTPPTSAASSSGGELPATGDEVLWIALAAALVLSVGIGLTVTARRS